MSVYQTSEADIVGLFNRKIGQTLLRSDLLFGTPVVNTDGSHSENTKLRIAIVPTHPTLEGSDDFYVNRLDLARLSSYPAPDYPPIAPAGTSVYSLLSGIKSSMGIDFTQNDLEETFSVAGPEGGSVLLKAKSTSIGWIGEFNLPLGTKPLLSTLFTRDYILWS